MVRYSFGVLAQIVEAIENEPRQEAKAALQRLQQIIRTMPLKETT